MREITERATIVFNGLDKCIDFFRRFPRPKGVSNSPLCSRNMTSSGMRIEQCARRSIPEKRGDTCVDPTLDFIDAIDGIFAARQIVMIIVRGHLPKAKRAEKPIGLG